MCADSFGLSQAVEKVTRADKDALREELKLKDGLTFLFVGQNGGTQGYQGITCSMGAAYY